MSKVPLPGNGCYVATRATSTWQEVACRPAPDVILAPGAISGGGPPKLIIGGHNGIDVEPQTASPISWAEGSFPLITGLTTETDSVEGTNEYSLQLNSNKFVHPICQGAPPSLRSSCRGWQQFAYVPGSLFMQYWLVSYNLESCSGSSCCPSGWTQYDDTFRQVTDCYKSAAGVFPPAEPITNLSNMRVIGTAGSNDTAIFSSGNDTLYALSAPTVLNLNSNWTAAEFNIFGYNLASNAQFNDNVAMVVQILTNTTPVTTAAPSYLVQSETGETNSLTLTPNSECRIAGTRPGVQFMQSNNGTGAQACPLAPSQVQLPVAFQANTNSLWIDRNNSGSNQFFGMKPGTVPSLVTVPGGVAAAFQANTGNFWLEDQNGNGTDSGIAMYGTTNPSIARLSGGQIAVAFHGANGTLWVAASGPASARDTGLVMQPGSSPSLVALPGGQYAVGFQAPDGEFTVTQNGNGDAESGHAMQGSTSPSIAAFSDGTIMVAFQGANGNLWVGVNGVFSAVDQHFGMKANTSPSAAVMFVNRSTAVAFQANTNELWIWRDGSAHGEGLGMFGANPPASPILSPMPDNGYQIAFKANTSNLWIDLNGVGMDQHLGMN